MRPRNLLRPLLSLFLVLTGMAQPRSASAQPVAVVVNGSPIAPLPEQPGTGLCSASSSSQDPANDFPQSRSTFISGINAFLEAGQASRITSVLRTAVDLSNNLNDGRTLSYGDFTGAVTGCGTGGCAFPFNDATTAFATRLRGLLAVTDAMVGKPLHFGLYADDAVSLTLFDRNQTAYAVIVRPPTLGFPTWRATNTVTFQQPGLYGVEVLYTQVQEHAALELSLYDGTFADFERPANQPPVVNLSSAGFVLVTHEMFHQSESGGASFPDLTQCAQCGRQNVNAPGNGGCGAGYHCNAAALCSPCDSELYCGEACSPCGAQTPYCVSQSEGYTCAQCRDASDCEAPDACHIAACTESGTCSSTPAANGTTCPGGTCQEGACVPLDAGTPDGGATDAGEAPDAGGGGADGGGAETDGGNTGTDGGNAGTDAGSPDGSVPDPDGGQTGTPDSGTTPDAGNGPGTRDGGLLGDDDVAENGCGCGGGAPGLAPMALLGLALFLRRSRKHPALHR
ncbi:outer membrane exchange protein TraA family protein [Pyxidicoccus sp. 3LG]